MMLLRWYVGTLDRWAIAHPHCFCRSMLRWAVFRCNPRHVTDTFEASMLILIWLEPNKFLLLHPREQWILIIYQFRTLVAFNLFRIRTNILSIETVFVLWINGSEKYDMLQESRPKLGLSMRQHPKILICGNQAGILETSINDVKWASFNYVLETLVGPTKVPKSMNSEATLSAFP